jgi:threonine dehydrogenase-like Zn-dependent dehydrogenase
VIVEDVTMCGACEACKTGRYDLCRNPYRLDGQGGMADQMVVHENMLNRFEGIDWVTASMTEPLAVAISCVEKLNLPPMGSLLIYGMGAIGLLSAAYAKVRGVARVDMVARDPSSLRNARAAEAARALGADGIFYTQGGGLMPGEGIYDAALVAASPALAADALARVRYGASALVAGITLSGGALSSIDVNHMVMNKKSLITSLAEPAVNFPLSLRLIGQGRIDVAAIITHRLALHEAGRLEALYGRDAGAIKTVMLCG